MVGKSPVMLLTYFHNICFSVFSQHLRLKFSMIYSMIWSWYVLGGISLIIFFIGEPMRAFPGFDKIVEIKASSKAIDLISFLINDINGVVVDGSSVKINCVSLVTTDEGGVVELVAHVLVHVLGVRVVILLVVAHVVHVVVRVGGVVLVALAGVFEFANFERLLDENVLHVVW